jgi:Tol biopolymer transport system component
MLFFYMLITTLLLTVGNMYVNEEEENMDPEILPISEIIGDGFPIQASVSPNGEWIAWYQRHEGLCIYHIASKSSNCYDWPPEEAPLMADNMFFNQPSFNWSPDSTKLSFSRNINNSMPFDSDIWIFDILTITFQNMTDDDFTGIAIPGAEGDDADMDTLPIWVSAEHIFFIRFATQVSPFSPSVDGWRRDPRLMQLDVATGEVEVVLDLSEDFFSDIPLLSVSPDGHYIALWLYNNDTPNTDAVWIYDKESQEIELLLTRDDIRAMSDFDAINFYPVDIVWTRDGDMILSLAILSASLRIEDYILVKLSPQSGQLQIISGGLAVHSSAYHAETDTVYFYHSNTHEERVASISRVSLSDGTIHLLQENAQPRSYPQDGRIRYFR